jgi:hypothetical protein
MGGNLKRWGPLWGATLGLRAGRGSMVGLSVDNRRY